MMMRLYYARATDQKSGLGSRTKR